MQTIIFLALTLIAIIIYLLVKYKKLSDEIKKLNKEIDSLRTINIIQKKTIESYKRLEEMREKSKNNSTDISPEG